MVSKNRHDPHDEFQEWDVISMGYESKDEADEAPDNQAKGLQRRSIAEKLTHSTTELTRSVHSADFSRAAEIVDAVAGDMRTKVGNWIPVPKFGKLPGIKVVSSSASWIWGRRRGTLESRVSTTKYRMALDGERLESSEEGFLEAENSGVGKSQETSIKEEKEMEFLRNPIVRKDSGFEEVELGDDEEKNGREDSG